MVPGTQVVLKTHGVVTTIVESGGPPEEVENVKIGLWIPWEEPVVEVGNVGDPWGPRYRRSLPCLENSGLLESLLSSERAGNLPMNGVLISSPEGEKLVG